MIPKGSARGSARGKTVIGQCGEACLSQFGRGIAFVGVTIAGDGVNDDNGGIAIPHLFGKSRDRP
jgi:hypothetical protein